MSTQLYYSPGACSPACRIALEEAELAYSAVCVDLRKKRTEHGDDYMNVAAKGYVPLLVLSNGEQLTETAVILQYVADQVPGKQLIPPYGSFERYRVQEWLNFVSAELHKRVGLLFNPSVPADMKTIARQQILQKCAWIVGQLGDRQYLVGSNYTVADAYLGWSLTGLSRVDIDIGQWLALQAYAGRFSSRPAVRAAMMAEGLLPAAS